MDVSAHVGKATGKARNHAVQ